MGLGAVSFVHVVKAAEPVFAAVLSAIFAGNNNNKCCCVSSALVPWKRTDFDESRFGHGSACVRFAYPRLCGSSHRCKYQVDFCAPL